MLSFSLRGRLVLLVFNGVYATSPKKIWVLRCRVVAHGEVGVVDIILHNIMYSLYE